MIFKWIFSFFLAANFFYSAHAFDTTIEKTINGEAHGIGIGGTVYETWGFTYRHYLPSNIGIVANLGGWLNENWGHLGIASGLSYTLAHHFFPNSALPSSSIRIYGIAYVAGIVRKGYSSDSDEKRTSFELGLGVGPGAEYFFTKNFAIHLELPWMTFIKITKKSTSFSSSYPHLGGGISYYF